MTSARRANMAMLRMEGGSPKAGPFHHENSDGILTARRAEAAFRPNPERRVSKIVKCFRIALPGVGFGPCPSCAAGLGAPRRRGRQGILGPGMARVAAPHFGPHRGVAAAPEPGQVARD